MSTENKTIGYIFPEADKFLKEKLLGMRKTAIKLFGTLGRQNKPLPDDTDIRSTVATIKAGHEHLFAEEMHHIKPEVHHAAFRSREKETDQKRAALDDEAEKLTHNIITAEHKIEGKTRPKTRKRSPWAVAFLILLYFGETVLNSLALEVGGGMPIWAAILAAAITGIEAVIAYRIARNIERLEAEGKKRLDRKTILLLVIISGLVIGMTELRGYALRELEGSFPSWVYFFINIGLLAATVIFSKYVWPSKTEQAQDAELRAQFDEIDAWKKRLAEIPAEKDTLKDALNEARHDYEVVMSHVRYTGETIATSYRETVELSKSENKIMRSDKRIPACFREPIPELDITIYKPEDHA